MLEYFCQRIKEKATDNKTAPVLIIPFGDSVTQGCTVNGVIEHQNAYHNVLKQKLEAGYPQTTFSVYNAGVGGETAPEGLKRIERDVIRHDPDLVIIGFCLNDSGGDLDGLEIYSNSIREIITRVRNETNADVILLTPNFMASKDNPNIAEAHQSIKDNLIRRQTSGLLRVYVETLYKIAKAMNVPVADVYAEWQDMENRGIDTTELLVNGLNHPGKDGQKLIADTVFNLIINTNTLSI